MARLGLSRAVAGSGREWVDLCRRADSADIAAAFPADLANGDCFVDAALALAATSRLPIGITVALPTRSPLQTASAAASLAEYAPGRVALGLAIGNAQLNGRAHNVPYDPPYQVLREYHAAITRLLRAPKGAPVAIEGQFHRAAGIGFGLDSAELPVLIGASGPRLTRLAGKVSDGLAIQILTPLPQLASRANAARSAHGEGPFVTIAGMIASVDADEGVASRRARAELAAALSFPRMRPRLGVVAPNVVEQFDRLVQDDIAAAANLLSDEIVRSFCLVATPSTLAAEAAAIDALDIVIPAPPGIFAGYHAAALGFAADDATLARQHLLTGLLGAHP